MSAWIVSKAHIDAIVTAAIDRDLIYVHDHDAFDVTPSNANVVGRMLVDECIASVSYRYPDDDIQAGELPGPCDAYYLEPYSHSGTRPIADAEIARLVGCYEYQSCEHPAWDGSQAHAVCDALQATVRDIPPDDSAPWGFEEEHRYATPAAAEQAPRTPTEAQDRNATIKAIRAALKRRSGKTWSVTGGRGTAWGWISISAPPRRCVEWGYMTDADCAELGELLSLGRPAHCQGVSVPASTDHRAEYIDRAEGREPSAYGQQYWD